MPWCSIIALQQGVNWSLSCSESGVLLVAVIILLLPWVMKLLLYIFKYERTIRASLSPAICSCNFAPEKHLANRDIVPEDAPKTDELAIILEIGTKLKIICLGKTPSDIVPKDASEIDELLSWK